jgi:tetratricopeptide (TPR) repeat protein
MRFRVSCFRVSGTLSRNAGLTSGLLVGGAALGLLLALVPAVHAQTNWPKATLTLKNNRPFKAELLGRKDREWLRIRRLDNPAEIQLPDADVVQIEFELPLEESGGMAAYAEGNFSEAADRLGPLLEPTLRFMNVSNNLQDEAMSYLRSLYWAGRHTQTLAACDTMLARLDEKTPLGRDTQLYRILTLLAQGQYERVERAFATLPAPRVDDEWAAEYWIIKATLEERANKMAALQDTSARIIAFRSRDLEWMPLALVFSARSYLATGEVAVARQILEEIDLVFPRAACSNKIEHLRQDLAARSEPQPPEPDVKKESP